MQVKIKGFNKGGTSRLKALVAGAALTVGLLASGDASAQSCFNDDDCTADLACGGPVCDWLMDLTCQPAGRAAKGQDGWCTTDDDCKCKSLGAVCVGVNCSFTMPSQAPGATGGASGSTGGASGSTGGASGSTGGASGSTGGASGSTGGVSGTDAGTKPSSDGGGCAIAGTEPAAGLGVLMALAALAPLVRRRRRV